MASNVWFILLFAVLAALAGWLGELVVARRIADPRRVPEGWYLFDVSSGREAKLSAALSAQGIEVRPYLRSRLLVRLPPTTAARRRLLRAAGVFSMVGGAAPTPLDERQLSAPERAPAS